MAIIYKVDCNTKKLIEVYKIKETIEIAGVLSITQFDSTFDLDLDDLKTVYQGYDSYYNGWYKVKSDIHFHDDKELRFIIKGKPIFYVYHYDILYIAECNVLDLVSIESNTLHWFESDGELLVYRFFKDNNERFEHEPDIIPLNLITIKEYIDNNGYNFKF